MSLSLKEKEKDYKTKVAELREYHQETFNALGIPDAYFYPKIAYRPKGKEELHISLFPSELRKGTDVYTEFVAGDTEPQDPNRTLWRLYFNPHWEEEYDTTTPSDDPKMRYLIPVSELVKVTAPSKFNASANLKVTEFDDFSNLLQDDAPMSEMTIKDLAAILLKKPISNKKWLNDLVK